MNSLDETARVRDLAFPAMRTPASEIRALALMFMPLPAAAHGAFDGPLLLAVLSVPLAIGGLVHLHRQRRVRPLKLVPRSGPGRHRLGWLSVPALLAALALSAVSGWAALVATVAVPLTILTVLPWQEAAQVRALQARLARPTRRNAPPAEVAAPFHSPAVTTLAALLQMTHTVAVDDIARLTGSDVSELSQAATTLTERGLADTALLRLPGRAKRTERQLFVVLTRAGRAAWDEHLHSLAEPA